MTETIEKYFLPPPPDALLWRYMNFPKFMAMLVHRGVFFVRVSKFDDPFEGSYPRKLVEAGPPTLIRHPQLSRFDRHLIVASCWHRSDHESAALWGLYAGDSGGIAIAARSGDLAKVLPTEALFGEIRYLDYETEVFPGRNNLYPYIHKRQSFAHEHEVRAIIWQTEHYRIGLPLDDAHTPQDPGIWVPTGLDFIEAVRLVPRSPDWLLELTRAVAATHDLRAPISRSDIDRDPLF